MTDKKKPLVLGITGTIASGKSLVGRLLAAKGIPVLDTDKVTHALLEDDLTVKTAIFQEFGPSVFQAKNPQLKPTEALNQTMAPETISSLEEVKVNRKALGNLVFSDEGKRFKLEKIIHPNVIAACRKEIEKLPDQKIVAILAPLLFEANLAGEYDEIWATYTEEATLKERLKDRDKLSVKEITARLESQLPQTEKCHRADHVIDNSGSIAHTNKQVSLLLKKLSAKKEANEQET